MLTMGGSMEPGISWNMTSPGAPGCCMVEAARSAFVCSSLSFCEHKHTPLTPSLAHSWWRLLGQPSPAPLSPSVNTNTSHLLSHSLTRSLMVEAARSAFICSSLSFCEHKHIPLTPSLPLPLSLTLPFCLFLSFFLSLSFCIQKSKGMF